MSGPDAPSRRPEVPPEPPEFVGEPPEEGTGHIAPRSLVANSSWLLASRVVGIVLSGGLAIYAIRTLSVQEWGRYSIVISLIAIFTVVTEAGLATLTLRELSSHPEHESRTLRTALSAVLTTGTASVLLMLLTAAVLGYWAWPVLIALAAATLVFQAIATPLFAVFNAHRVLVYPAIVSGAGAVLSTAVAVALVATGAGVAGLLVGALTAQALAVTAGYVLLRRKFGLRPRARRPDAESLRFIRLAIPIAATGGLTIVYQRLDILMLSKLTDDAEVAIYSVPFSVLQYSWVVPQIIAAAYFPILNSTIDRDRTGARDSFFLMVRLFFLLSLPMTVFLVVGGGPVLTTLFGEAYAESETVLSIMAWISVLGFQNYLLWYAIIACHRERHVVAIQASGLALNALLNLILIPHYGAEGAAAALLASDFVVVAGQAWLVHRHVFRVPWRRVLLWPVVAGVLSAPVIVLVGRTSDIAAAVAGTLLYLGILLAGRYIAPGEWQPLRDPVMAALGRLRRSEAGA